MSKCHAPNCSNEIFSHLYCKYHQYMRRLQGGDLFVRKSKQNKPVEARSTPKRSPIPPMSKKRSTERKAYKEQAKDFFNEAVINGTNICVFCGEKVTKFEGLHHWKGRTNDYLLDKRWWSTVHNFCHVDCYHQSDYEHLSKQVWFQSFLNRLKIFDPTLELYNMIRKKGEKSQNINRTIDFDEELF
jgi:hypothetical protein